MIRRASSYRALLGSAILAGTLPWGGSAAAAELTLATSEHGSWNDTLAALRGDLDSEGRVLHLVVRSAEKPIACGRYGLELDRSTQAAFRVGACDPATGATALVLEHRAGLFDATAHIPTPRTLTISALLRATAVGGGEVQGGSVVQCTWAVRPYLDDALHGTRVLLTPPTYALRSGSAWVTATPDGAGWSVRATQQATFHLDYEVVETATGKVVLRHQMALTCAPEATPTPAPPPAPTAPSPPETPPRAELPPAELPPAELPPAELPLPRPQGGSRDPSAAVFESITAGGESTCGLRKGGTVACWGKNALGQLGDGTTIDRTSPVTVRGLTDVVEVAVGYRHACARKRDGTVACWGGSVAGEIGDVAPSTCTERVLVREADPPKVSSYSYKVRCALTPVGVKGLDQAAQIAAGLTHTCARKTDGTVVCWGRNKLGELGDGTTIDRPAPTTVSGLTSVGAIAIATGVQGTTCARLQNGRVACWGQNDHGQVGDGTHVARTVPFVGSVTDAAQVVVGDYHTCVRTTGGLVSCWGEGVALGEPYVPSSPAPRLIGALRGIVEISATSQATCARKVGGAVVCWGNALGGSLGDGQSDHTVEAVSVKGLSDAVEIRSGSEHTCARRRDGTVVCWGENEHGQLGFYSREACVSGSPCAKKPGIVRR